MSRRGLALFIALSIIWGTPYLFIRIAVEYVEPSVMVALRVALAAILLLPVALARGQFRGIRPYLPWVAVFALVEITGPFLMLGYAETALASSTTALLIAAVPMSPWPRSSTDSGRCVSITKIMNIVAQKADSAGDICSTIRHQISTTTLSR